MGWDYALNLFYLWKVSEAETGKPKAKWMCLSAIYCLLLLFSFWH
jgi:hypothetical protein